MDYFRFILRRVLQSIPVLLGVGLLTFFIMRMVPGDPALIMLGRHATPERLAVLHEKFGLDKSIWIQAGYFVRDLARGDLGTSIITQEPVTELIFRRVEVTLFLIAYSTVLALLITLPVATLAARNRDRLFDQIARGFFTVTMTMPNFWIGIILMLIFSIYLGIFPVSGYGVGFMGHLRHLFLPSVTIGLYLSSLAIRSLRTSLLDLFGAGHVSFARAKGLSESKVFSGHVLRNGLISTVTVLGITVGWLYGSSAVIERVFSIPGAGLLLIDSVFRRDYPVIQGLIITFGFLVIFTNFLVDLIYALLDPRVRV